MEHKGCMRTGIEDKDILQFTQTDGEILFEWNNLCYEKLKCGKREAIPNNCVQFNRDYLINLKILPFKARLHPGRSFDKSPGNKINNPDLDDSTVAQHVVKSEHSAYRKSNCSTNFEAGDLEDIDSLEVSEAIESEDLYRRLPE
ncbi:hypothetical protein F5884DRAFT_758105 [Xylogone sp. PMI_703]|nr:hypothetical protein F5884DRAFT_758105 [Xylogone sp. PMI_703]